jgi:Fe-S-cluster containining protein
MDKAILSQVLDLYEEVDRTTEAFRDAIGLSCPPGCGSCCSSTEVESTVLEALPLAEHLWSAGEAEQWLDRIAKSESATCVFYGPNELFHGCGRCRIYPWRPLVCRLFGYAAVRMKNGDLEMTICSFLRSRFKGIKEKADDLARSGFRVLVCSDEGMRLTGIDPTYGTKRLPVNQAVRDAIEKTGFIRGLEGS